MSANVPAWYWDCSVRCDRCGKTYNLVDGECNCTSCMVCGLLKPPYDLVDDEICFDCLDKENMADA